MKRLTAFLLGAVALVAAVLTARDAMAFCGFYVAKADTKIFNQASQVALVRDGDRTVLTMANDFQRDVKEFAMVMTVRSPSRTRATREAWLKIFVSALAT